jgi:hypothetical protein
MPDIKPLLQVQLLLGKLIVEEPPGIVGGPLAGQLLLQGQGKEPAMPGQLE